MPDPSPGHVSGTGRGVRERRLRRLHCKVAPHRRSHTASEGLHSTLFQPPLGAPVVVPEGWRRRPPGRSGPFPAQATCLAGPDRRGRRSPPTRPRRSRQRPLAGRDDGSISEPRRGWIKTRKIFSEGPGHRPTVPTNDPPVVIAGLDPAIHSVGISIGWCGGMDARLKAGHDGCESISKFAGIISRHAGEYWVPRSRLRLAGG
jgi:hypothetical protein